MNLRQPPGSLGTRQAPREPRSNFTWLFGAFALLFAISLILHQLWWGGFEVRSPHFVVILAAFWTILRLRTSHGDGRRKTLADGELSSG